MKTPKNYNKAISLKILTDGYCKSINNARRLIDDGEILIKCGRFLTAINCFRLAVEELAKAILIMEVVVFDKDDKDEWKWFWRAFHSHKEKIRLLERKLHWPSYQDKNEFHKRVNTLLTQREESIYVQYDSNKKEFLSPEDFFLSKDDLSSYAKNELQYALKLYGFFISMTGEPEPDIILKVFKEIKKERTLKKSNKKFIIRGYVKGQDSPVFYDDADSLEEARAKAKDAFKKGDFEKVVFWEEVKKREKGIANTIQRDKNGKIEEVKGRCYGEEEVIT